MKRWVILIVSLMLAAARYASVPRACAEPAEADIRIQQIMKEMTTEQKLAQMIIVAFRSDAANTSLATEMTPAYSEMLQRYDFGGVLLFTGNIIDTAQTVTLIRDCQTAALASEPGIPLLMCVDQEGGQVNRVAFGTAGPGNMALAAAGDPALAEECADILGQEIAALGFNMDFAPVCDVNSNPRNPIIGVRSFSDDPRTVAEYAAVFMRGLHKNGIAVSLKHFPGHGNVGEDSHTSLPCSDMTEDELNACDLIPFRACIEAGTDMIMTAHIQYPRIEKGTYISKADGKEVTLPATLSRTIMTDLLRGQMGYDGIIITDAMGMAAIAQHFDPLDAAALAINAGVDILLLPVDLYQGDGIDTLPDMDAYMEGLLARVKTGEISEARLDESVERILKLKLEKGILDADYDLPAEEQTAAAMRIVGSAEHHVREWEMAQKAMTLLKNSGDMLPLNGRDGRRTLILYPAARRQPAVDYAVSRLEREDLADSGKITALCYGDLTAEDVRLQEALAEADRVLVLSQSSAPNETVIGIMEQCHREKEIPAALLSLNLPYDAACYPEADAVLCAYQPYGSAHDSEGRGPFNLNVAVALCTAFGQTAPTGRLPVQVPVYEPGIGFTDEILYPAALACR